MKKLIASVLAALAFCRTADAAPVTWSFYETAIVLCDMPGACALPPQPYELLSLTLPGATSTGTASWGNSGAFAGGTPAPPVYTGDNFALAVPNGSLNLSSSFSGNANNPEGLSCFTTADPTAVCGFNISWTETAGTLDAVSITASVTYDEIGANNRPLGLTGGWIASDFTLGGCADTQCQIAGFWQSDLAAVSVPEPMSAIFLITGLLGTCLVSCARLRARVSWN